MRTKSVWTKWLVLIFSVSLLVSCGGGGGGGGTPPAPADEGSIASPVNLGTVSTTVTYPGSVGALGTSYYKFTAGSTPGAYTISLTNTQSNLSWDLYSDSLFTTPVGSTCNNSNTTGPNNESCSVTLTAGATYYLAVDEWDAVAGTYTLTATPPVPPATPGGVAATAGYGKVTISWYNATGATSYNIYWSTTSGGASSGGTKISGITTTTSYDHVVTTTGIPYYYVVTAENVNGESAKSTPEVTATPLAKQVPPLDYNFDDGTLQGWTTNGIWNVNTVYANSGTYSVTDSPLGNYQNSSNTWLASPMIDLTATTTPQLTFWHRYQTETDYDKAYVEISTDGGNTFTNITPGLPGYLYYSGTLSTFTLVTIDLSAYKASNTVVIRFRLQTDSSMWYDGWYIDDIGISAI